MHCRRYEDRRFFHRVNILICQQLLPILVQNYKA